MVIAAPGTTAPVGSLIVPCMLPVVAVPRALEQLGLERIGNGSELLARAAEVAKEYSISGHDATFAAAAALVQGVWLTADKAALRKMRSAGFAKLLQA